MVKQKRGVKEDLIVPIKNAEPKSNVPTPEQMRIAEILEKKVVDSNIKLKLKQIMDATQRSADEVYVALHDSDFDVNRAVNLLIEGEDQLSDWCTNEKRKKKLAELKEKKEEVAEAEPQPDKAKPVRGKGEERRPGRRQEVGRQKAQDEPKKQTGSEPRASRNKRPGFGSMVFERSNPPPIDVGILPPVKNHWEKPLLKANGPEDEWDCEEFQGSLSQTLIFPSSKRPEPPEVLEELQTPKVPSPRPVPLSTLTFTNKSLEQRDQDSPQKRDPPADIRPNIVDRSPLVSSDDRPCINPTLDRPCAIPRQDRSVTLPAEPRPDYIYRLNYSKPNQEDKRPPSKIPTLPVEMPPELKPSLSFLDIQFGAMDLSETGSECQSNLSNASSQNPSATTLLSPQSLPSSCSATNLMAKTSSSANNASGIANSTNCSSLPTAKCTNSPRMGIATNPQQGMHSISCQPAINSITNPPGLKSISNPGVSMNTKLSSAVNQSFNLNSITNSSNMANMSTPTGVAPVDMVPPSSISGSVSHVMGQSSVHQSGANMGQPNSLPNIVPNTTYTTANLNQNRYMTSSQAFNGSHMQYGIINPPVTTHGYETRDNAPPPHPPAHLPPFKSPPTVPKGPVVPNLPPGPLVGNQYLVGQGNVPYFPHPPIYYYEEVPPVMNSQQRLTNMSSHSHHYDVTYQTAPSTRDSVHYNV